jgi:predicted small metal-binding protein
MLKITCHDIGVNCDFEARGATVDDVLKLCVAHARKEHGFKELPPDVLETVKAAIREDAA